MSCGCGSQGLYNRSSRMFFPSLPECTKIVRISAVAPAIFIAPRKITRLPGAASNRAICLRSKIASKLRFWSAMKMCKHDPHSESSLQYLIYVNERPRAHPMRTHPKWTQGECLQLFFPSPHEAAVWPSATVAKNIRVLPLETRSSLLKCLILIRLFQSSKKP